MVTLVGWCSTLHVYEDRPRACLLYPFYIFNEPEYGDTHEAEFLAMGRRVFVYIDKECPGVGTGNRETGELVSETISRWLGVGGVTRESLAAGEVVCR